MSAPKLNYDLRLLVLCRALVMSNVQVPFFVLFLIRDLHAPIATALQAYASFGLLGAALEVPTGWFADRFGRKLSIVAGSVFCIWGLCMYATASSLGLWFLSGAVLSYTGWSLVNGADSALATDICAQDYDPDLAERAYVHFETQSTRITGLSMAAGSLLGAFMVWRFGLRSTMWAQAAIYVPLLACACLVKSPAKQARRKAPSALAITKSLAARKQLLAVFVFAAIIGAVTNIAWKVVPLYYTSVHIGSRQLPASGLGLLWALYLASQYLVKPSHPHRFQRRFGHYGSFAILLGLGVACYLTIGVETSLAGLAAIFVTFWILPMQRPRLLGLTRDLSHPEERATIMSMFRSASYLVMSVASIAIATVIRFAGLSAGLMFAGALLGLTGGYALWYLAAKDRAASGEQAKDKLQTLEVQS